MYYKHNIYKHQSSDSLQISRLREENSFKTK